LAQLAKEGDGFMITWLKRLFAARKPSIAKPTMDKRTAKNIASLDRKAQPVFAELWRIGSEVAGAAGCSYVLISGNRTYKEQAALYAIGRTLEGDVVTNAKAGYSNHNFGIAGDFGVFRDGKYLDSSEPQTAQVIHKAVATAAERAGLNIEWGGSWRTFKDYPHFEVRTDFTMHQKRERMASVGSVL
jgi:peptidoglycan L-alanyl-D-glutamate endopeptidase CwlK